MHNFLQERRGFYSGQKEYRGKEKTEDLSLPLSIGSHEFVGESQIRGRSTFLQPVTKTPRQGEAMRCPKRF